MTRFWSRRGARCLGLGLGLLVALALMATGWASHLGGESNVGVSFVHHMSMGAGHYGQGGTGLTEWYPPRVIHKTATTIDPSLFDGVVDFYFEVFAGTDIELTISVVDASTETELGSVVIPTWGSHFGFAQIPLSWPSVTTTYKVKFNHAGTSVEYFHLEQPRLVIRQENATKSVIQVMFTGGHPSGDDDVSHLWGGYGPAADPRWNAGLFNSTSQVNLNVWQEDWRRSISDSSVEGLWQSWIYNADNWGCDIVNIKFEAVFGQYDFHYDYSPDPPPTEYYSTESFLRLKKDGVPIAATEFSTKDQLSFQSVDLNLGTDLEAGSVYIVEAKQYALVMENDQIASVTASASRVCLYIQVENMRGVEIFYNIGGTSKIASSLGSAAYNGIRIDPNAFSLLDTYIQAELRSISPETEGNKTITVNVYEDEIAYFYSYLEDTVDFVFPVVQSHTIFDEPIDIGIDPKIYSTIATTTVRNSIVYRGMRLVLVVGAKLATVFDLLHTMPVSTVKAFGHTRWQGTPLDFDNDFDGIVEAFMEIETNITGADVQEAEVRLFRDNTQIAAIQFTNHGIDVFRTGDISAALTSGTYSVETEVTQATNQYQSAVFYNVRLVVIQRNPTKTVLEFPLSIGGKGFWVAAQGWGWSVNQYNDYEHNTFDHAYYPYGSYPRFMTGFPYTAANFDGIDAIEFVVYAQNEDYGSYGTDMEFRLFNHTDGTPVSGTLIQAPANTFARYSVSLGATDLADGKFYRVQGRTVSFESGKDGDIQGAFLYFKLNNFTKAEVHFPIDFKLTGDSGKGWNSWYGRALFNPDWYSTDSIRFRGWVTKMLIHDPNSLLVGPYGGTAYAGSGIAPVTDGGDESTGYYELKTSGPLDLSELIEAVHGIYQPDGANSTSAGHKVLVISGRMGAGSGGPPPEPEYEAIAGILYQIDSNLRNASHGIHSLDYTTLLSIPSPEADPIRGRILVLESHNARQVSFRITVDDFLAYPPIYLDQLNDLYLNKKLAIRTKAGFVKGLLVEAKVEEGWGEEPGS